MKIAKKNKSIYVYLKKLKYKFLSRKFGIQSDQLFQTASTTFMNRHPDIFNILKDQYGSKKINILSFGCSTGEECFSLRKYLPNATIYGIDINPENIEIAKNNDLKDEQIIFKQGNLEQFQFAFKFDVILALSVLCKNPEAEILENISCIYPFETYEKTINHLNDLLKINGLLIIRSSNFRFRDTSIFKKFEVFKTNKLRTPILFPKFDSNNNRLIDYLENEEIFQKTII
jgi:chemotaxis methyl-accepting protein methylase